MLQQNFFREACNYLPANIIELKDNVRPAGYATRNNLYPDGITLDVREASRLGALLGVTHVLAVYVREYRPYHPQVLTLRLSLIDVRAQRQRVNMESAFDATQQQLMTTMADYLQQRRARKNDTTSLDVMLRSPAEYAAFAASFCCKRLAQTLAAPWRRRHLTPHVTGKRGTPCILTPSLAAPPRKPPSILSPSPAPTTDLSRVTTNRRPLTRWTCP
jgi:hypothetical protein